MRDAAELERTLLSLDGQGYKAYKRIGGSWRYELFTLHVDHVQGDPFADPSRVRVELAPEVAALPSSAFRTGPRSLGTACFLARALARAALRHSIPAGTGRSGEIGVRAPGQEVMEQTAVLVGADGAVEARFTVGLPARGRRVLGREAARLLGPVLERVVEASLRAGAHDPADIEAHAATNEDAEHLRRRLDDMGLVAFVADGASLPRRSGIDDRPLEGAEVVRFTSPASLRVEVDLPNAGPVTGMGIRRGVTLIAGGGFHGKSTLLRAIEAGVYNHRPGDGRERVVSDPDAVKVRADDGRSVAGVDISGFIDDLPLGQDTSRFTTTNASGSTSQAAAIAEALESGASVLLVDEDTSATNFMLRDRRMQTLVPKEAEPITPFVDRVRELLEERGVSTVLVVGGSGDYLDVADTVIAMRAYRPEDVTERARAIAREQPTGRRTEARAPLAGSRPRRPLPGSVDPSKGRRRVHVKVPDARTLLVGAEVIDLAGVEQLASREQIRAIGHALAHLAPLCDGERDLSALLSAVEEAVAAAGLDALDARRPGDLATFRRHELAAALNRSRALVVG